MFEPKLTKEELRTARLARRRRMTPSSGGAIGAPGGKTANIARLPELLQGLNRPNWRPNAFA